MSRSHYIIPIFVPHIGCPHNCVFCNQNTITGKKEIKDSNVQEITKKSCRNIIEEYLNTINKYGNEEKVIEVSFFGGTFTAIPLEKQIELLEVAYEYKCKEKINFIRLSTRPDYIDISELNILKKYGVDIIELGVQSLDNDVLKCSGRGHSSDVVKTASNLIKEFNITLGIQVMLGLPCDNFAKDIKTAKEVCEIKPDICRIYPSLVIKDTPMETMFKKGEYTPYSLKETIEICKIVYSMFISNDINVIRVGLQPTEDINEGAEVVTGPFHPAFRELMESSLLNEMIFKFLKDINSKEIQIIINPKNVSKLYSNKKYYFNEYNHKYYNGNIEVIQDFNVEKDEIKIKIQETCKTMSFKKFLEIKSKEGNKYLL
ncbi:elongator complex protein 3 [Hathewaya limosa]|uniref:Histone acetyltransferase (RNA polymerase elongator complex component) n=1 Tax=Hathewaya limosa TaxID=1536 RepID=A0ABU0JPK7_HATLI|nr:radical SAM protein [Hathewaya limosa]MDQ0479017.1 histone acetyltransferase (RNA polymerase elongator complex component) [Hathewaya limosa]